MFMTAEWVERGVLNRQPIQQDNESGVQRAGKVNEAGFIDLEIPPSPHSLKRVSLMFVLVVAERRADVAFAYEPSHLLS